MSIILSSAYNAPIQYYTKFILGKKIIIEQYDSYMKQSYRNRCAIATADGPISLSIPVAYSSQERTKMKDVGISDHGNWQHTHWNAIVSAYNSTPFFEYYRDEYEAFYTQKYDNLLQFNDSLLRLTLNNLNIKDLNITYSDTYVISEQYPNADFRHIIHPKIDIELDNQFITREYYQVFKDKNGFVPNMSILDLLFNMGNESLLVLLHSISTNENRNILV